MHHSRVCVCADPADLLTVLRVKVHLVVYSASQGQTAVWLLYYLLYFMAYRFSLEQEVTVKPSAALPLQLCQTC